MSTKLKSTQVYLTGRQHAALQRAAERERVSMAGVLRVLVERYLMENESPPTDLTDLIGVVSTVEPTDVATQKDRLLDEGLYEDFCRHECSLRVAESERPPTRSRGGGGSAGP